MKSSKIGKDITHYLHRQDMKGCKDEVEGNIEQLKRILTLAEEDLNSEETFQYLERKREIFTKKI